MQTDEDKIKALIFMGSDITGAAGGGGIGFLIGGPAGAALGGPLGILIRRGLSDIANRILSTRERKRVGATAWYAITKIEERRNSGDMLRDDGFFEAKGKERSDAEEIFEGVLLKAKNEHEEKKTKILGNIFANTAFFPGFSVGEANHLLRIAESLTYRQMCILSLVKRKDEIQGINLREETYTDYWEVGEKIIPFETASTVQEAYEMYGFGLILYKDKTNKGSFWSLTEWTDIAPNGLELTPMGKRYYQVMGLGDVSEKDIKEVAKYLS